MTGPQSNDALSNEDWRYYAIGPSNGGTNAIATTERLAGSIVSFGLPSAPALFLSLSREAHARRINIDVHAQFWDHPTPQGKWAEDHARLFDFFEAFSAEIIFAFTAIEAFANESIPTGHSIRWRKDKKSVTLHGAEIERQVPINDKLKRILPEAHNISSPVGSKVWGDYLGLKSIRDRLIHLKSVDRKSSGPDDQTIWGLMLERQSQDFSQTAYELIGSFTALTNNRRWFRLAASSE